MIPFLLILYEEPSLLLNVSPVGTGLTDQAPGEDPFLLFWMNSVAVLKQVLLLANRALEMRHDNICKKEHCTCAKCEVLNKDQHAK